MTLEFEKIDDKFVSKFEVSGDFNIHIEKELGHIEMYQTTVWDGKYESIKSFKVDPTQDIIDVDMTALVYPKYLRIEAYTNTAPNCTITFA